jgi:ADP-heptose:LPS heptosyltransferase
MLQRSRIAAGLLGARWHFRSSRDDVISFADAISGAHHLLVIMPLHGAPLYPVAPVITMLRRRLLDNQITLVVSHHSTEALEALKHSPVIRVLPQETSFWFLPSRDVIARVGARSYDVAIDLNLDFLIPSGYICRESNARVRIGFAGRRADLFYNLQVQVRPTESRTQQYERMARCLQMF